jgi:hypothetical protein
LCEPFLESSYVLSLLDDENISFFLVNVGELFEFELVLHLGLRSPPLGSGLQKVSSVTFLGYTNMIC